MINPRAQVLALSATIRNADEIAAWLKAGLVTSSWRPVSLKEGVFCKGSIMFKDGEVRQVPPRQVRGSEKDPVADIAADTIKGGGQMLVFTGSRVSATSIAKRLEEPVRQLLKAGEERRLMDLSSKLLGMGERTRLSERLARSVSYGVAFHHAGLTYQQRKAVEDAFRAQLIKVIASTPTLAAGVNLPSRRVLIYDYKRYEAGLGRTNIPILEEKQMAGRAGRPRYDTVGEAILFSRTEEEREFLMEQYVLASPEKVWSKLGVASSLRSHILASITMGLAHSLDGIFEFLDGSFCAYQYGMSSYRSSVLEAVSSLKSSGMIREEGEGLVPTPLGARVSELYIDPASAKVMLDGLRVRRSGLPSLSYLTLVCHTPDMPKLYVRGKEAEQVMAYLQDNSDLLLYDLPECGSFEYEMVLAEVKTALMLKDWIEESTEDQIVERFDIGSGDIHAYVESAKWLVHAAHELARLMGYHESAAPLRSLLIRIESGVKEELLPLISLRGVGRVRARALHTAGYRSIEDLRRATPSDLGKLPQIGPETVKSIKEQVGGTVSKEEWSALISGKGSKQLLIESYGEMEGEEKGKGEGGNGQGGEKNGKSEGKGGRGNGGG